MMILYHPGDVERFHHDHVCTGRNMSADLVGEVLACIRDPAMESGESPLGVVSALAALDSAADTPLVAAQLRGFVSQPDHLSGLPPIAGDGQIGDARIHADHAIGYGLKCGCLSRVADPVVATHIAPHGHQRGPLRPRLQAVRDPALSNSRQHQNPLRPRAYLSGVPMIEGKAHGLRAVTTLEARELRALLVE